MEITLANISDMRGLEVENSQVIPLSRIIERASTTWINGQTRTIRRREAAAALDLLKSETNM